MTRKYDARRRAEAAMRTREAILDAAFKLHGQGVIDYVSLADEANVSLATVRKHFPTREALYEGCTAWGLQYASMPDLELLTATADAGERLRLAVRQTGAFYESLSGQIWALYLHHVNSPVLTRVLEQLDELRKEVVEAALAPWPAGDNTDEARGLLSGLLSFLTYRALRHDGGLSPEQTNRAVAGALEHCLESLRRGGGQGGRRD